MLLLPLSSRKIAVFMAILWLGVASAWAGSDADTAFLQGQKLLADGDLRAALKQYVAAVKSDRENQEYLQQYMLVRRAVALQDALAKETNAQQWEQMAVALRSFFSAQGLHAQALPLDRAMLERSKTADNAMQLADTLLSLEKNDEAAAVLSSLEGPQATSATQALLAVALARQGRADQAKKIAAGVQAPAKDDPGALYMVARMHAAMGNVDQALSTLTQCFEAVSPSRLAPLKSHAQECKDFSSVVSLASFATVLQTESKVPESKCSGGSSCSTCPMRGNCAHGAGK
jgi:tetratricopeptide (TPR) repeat protein